MKKFTIRITEQATGEESQSAHFGETAQEAVYKAFQKRYGKAVCELNPHHPGCADVLQPFKKGESCLTSVCGYCNVQIL